MTSNDLYRHRYELRRKSDDEETQQFVVMRTNSCCVLSYRFEEDQVGHLCVLEEHTQKREIRLLLVRSTNKNSIISASKAGSPESVTILLLTGIVLS